QGAEDQRRAGAGPALGDPRPRRQLRRRIAVRVRAAPAPAGGVLREPRVAARRCACPARLLRRLVLRACRRPVRPPGRPHRAGPAMLTMPDGTSVLVMEVVYAGDPAQGEKEIAPLLAVAKPLENGLKVQDYMVMQTQEDATFSHGIRSYAKNGMVKEITPELV